MSSRAAIIAALSPEERAAFYASLTPQEREALPYLWSFWGRQDQLPPAGDWRNWGMLGGRGAGKTKAASEWLRSEVEAGKRRRIAVVGPTADAVRRIQVEGPSGILSVGPPSGRPTYEPSVRRISWSNGAVANLYSSEEPDRIRGENCDAAWCDELCSWSNVDETWHMLQMALRIDGPKGDPPRCLITTTPKNIPLLREIIASPSTVVTRARTADNIANLNPETVKYLTERYAGTTLGRQELDAELLADNENALWSRDLIERTRVKAAPADLKRIVVAIDPSGSNNKTSDETGIVIVGKGYDDHAYVLADLSGKYSPEQWASKAVAAYRAFKADRIVAERNFGGDMVAGVLRSVGPNIPLKLLTASRGKVARAEPVVALFEQGKAHICGVLNGLEDQLTSWEPGGSARSPDRLDAMCWGVTELCLSSGQPARRVFLDVFSR